MVESILDATDYILIALSNIKTLEDLQEYKEEIKKAIIDIREITQNLPNSNNFSSNNLNNQESYINSNNTPSSNISSKLGFKFNYDAYLNDFRSRNMSPKNELNQEIKSDILNNNNNGNDDQNKVQDNSDINDIKKIKVNNNGIIPFKEENNKIISPSSIDYSGNQNKRLRNKYNVDIIGNKKNKSKLNGKKGKERINLLADIVMKINSEDYFYDILTEIYGDDLTDKLMSNDVNDNFLDSVLNSINEIEQLKKREGNKNRKEIMVNPYNKRKKLNINANNSFNDYNFINLRKFNSQVYNLKNFKNGRKKNNNSKKGRPFISTTCPYGNYFDPPLQNGGMSKLSFYKKWNNWLLILIKIYKILFKIKNINLIFSAN